jgi:hypothetical protein
MTAANTMKAPILILAFLGGFVLNSGATVSGPDNIVYGTITLGGVAVTAADTNILVAARLQPNGPPIATYSMGWLPTVGNFYSLRISVETVGSVLAPNAVLSNQVIYLDVDNGTNILTQTSFTVGPPGQITLLNFGSSSSVGSSGGLAGASSGSLSVTLLPAAAAAVGARWQVDAGPDQISGATVTNLSVGSHTVSFTFISDWTTPPNQTNVIITGGVTTMASGIYTQTNAGLTLLTNGYGSIQHAAWPAVLVPGKAYKVKAVPAAKNVFVSWVGGTNQPYSVLSTSASYTFSNQSFLLLEANFETNVFLAAAGTYSGLFAPTNSARQQTDSGSFLSTVSSSGAVSGSLEFGNQTVSFSGTFNSDGAAEINSKGTRNEPSLSITLQLDFADQSVSGTISNSTFTAELNGNRDVFGKSDQAAAFEGQYTLVIPGTNNPTTGPFGVSYGTVKVSSTGAITLAGSLADGTAISQSSEVSQDGYWPLYVNLYSGKGSLWGWNYFTNHTLTNASAISWINATNSARTAVYRSGFTNQQATLTGGIFTPGQTLPSGLIATLQESNLAAITITNKLTLKTNRTTGVISGSFANPTEPKQTIKFNGVILQGQTNAQGYSLGTNQSDAFLLELP